MHAKHKGIEELMMETAKKGAKHYCYWVSQCPLAVSLGYIMAVNLIQFLGIYINETYPAFNTAFSSWQHDWFFLFDSGHPSLFTTLLVVVPFVFAQREIFTRKK